MRLLLFIAILLLTSCGIVDKLRERKENRRVENAVQTLKKYDRLDSLCAEEFPADTVTTVKRDTTTITDTITQDSFIDTVTVNDTVFITKWKDRVITKTEIQTVTVEIDKSKAEVAHMKDQLKEKDKEIGELKTDRDELRVQIHKEAGEKKKFLWMFIAACALIVGLIAVIVAILKGKKQVNRIT